MPSLTQDEIVMKKHKRAFIQFGGARPNNPTRYAGQDATYLVIEGVSNPESGGIDPVWVPDLRRAGQYRLVGRTIAPPDLASASLRMLEKHGSIPRQLARIGCAFNMYELTGTCTDLSDFINGWSDYVLIYAAAYVTDKDLGDRMVFDSDEQVEDTLSLTLSDIYPVGAISFGASGAATVTTEILDVVYGSTVQCGDCGATDDGTNRIFAISSRSTSGGDADEVVFTANGGSNWAAVNPTASAGLPMPVAIEVVGNKLLIMHPATYIFSTISSTTGEPGGVSEWSAMPTFTGFTTNNCNDVYALTPREVFFACNNGYIYKSTDVTVAPTTSNAGSATTSKLLRVHGKDDTVVCVGVDGASATTRGIVKSTDRGTTWAAVTPPSSGGQFMSVSVLDKNRYVVGSNTGQIWYTLNGGVSWTEIPFTNSGTGYIHDIQTPTDEVWYFVHNDLTPRSHIWATINGGVNWTDSAPRLNNWPTIDKANRIACPRDVDNATMANNLTVGGLADNATDGEIIIGIAAKF